MTQINEISFNKEKKFNLLQVLLLNFYLDTLETFSNE